MTKRNMRRAVMTTAKMLTAMVAPALMPDERKDFFLEAEKIIGALVEACHRQAGRERIRIKPSLN